MLARGDKQSVVAAAFGGENQGRISEINTGKLYSKTLPATPDELGSVLNRIPRYSKS
jgi:hypothetical protein